MAIYDGAGGGGLHVVNQEYIKVTRNRDIALNISVNQNLLAAWKVSFKKANLLDNLMTGTACIQFIMMVYPIDPCSTKWVYGLSSLSLIAIKQFI